MNTTALSPPLDLADILFINEIEGAGLAGLEKTIPVTEILDRLCTRYQNTEIILTAGPQGAYYGFRTMRAKGGIVDLPVVDTTGAGDCFSGYYLAARGRGLSIQDSLDIAGKAASITVSRKGAMESLPFKDEVFV